jgi:hypothetical protein
LGVAAQDGDIREIGHAGDLHGGLGLGDVLLCGPDFGIASEGKLGRILSRP